MHMTRETLGMFFQTLYRIDPRGKSFDDLRATEYYQPRIDTERLNGNEVFFVRETHGFFDDQKKQVASITETLNPENGDDGYSSREDAEARYRSQLRQRARDGFIHLFSFNPLSPDRMDHRLLDPNGEI